MDEYSIKDSWRDYSRYNSDNEKIIADYHLRKIERLAKSVYKWKAKEIDPDIIEKYLWEDGYCIIWESEDLGVVCTRCVIRGWDFNNLPKIVRPVFDTLNGYNVNIDRPTLNLSTDKVVFIQDSKNYRIKRSDCCVLIPNIVDTCETIKQQVFNQKTPMLAVSGSPNIKNKLKDAIIHIAKNVKVLFVDDDITNTIKPLNFNSPFNIDQLDSYKRSIENEMLEYCGIDNTPAFHKKERMITDEQEGNDEIINYMLADGLNARLKAVERIKNIFGFNWTVEIQDSIRPIQLMEEGEDNGNRPTETV